MEHQQLFAPLSRLERTLVLRSLLIRGREAFQRALGWVPEGSQPRWTTSLKKLIVSYRRTDWRGAAKGFDQP